MKKKNIVDKLFLIGLLLFQCLVLVKLLKNSNEYNYTENKMSTKFCIPSIEKIISGEYQDEFEEAISEQMPKYDLLKLAYSKISNFVNIETVYKTNLDKISRYIRIGTVYLYNGYLLYGNTDMKNFEGIAKNDIEAMNNVKDNVNANIYLYFVETDSTYNFETNYNIDTLKYFKSKLKIADENIGSYDIKSFEDYKDYFYKTDHHWNYKGAYRGYKDIAKLMHFDTILNPTDEICFNAKSSGSKTKSLGDDKYFNDKMCMYSFDFPKFKIEASGNQLDEYGNSISELKKASEISYGAIYGGDYDELVFYNENSDSQKKLLIFSNSYSNALNKLLAANYNTTYVVDGRYYKDFNMIDYINKNDIDDVLILANSMLLWDDVEWGD